MFDMILTGLVVSICIFYVAKRSYNSYKGKSSGCGCGSSSCCDSSPDVCNEIKK